MNMKPANWTALTFAIAFGLLTSVPAQAQPDNQPATPSPAACHRGPRSDP